MAEQDLDQKLQADPSTTSTDNKEENLEEKVQDPGFSLGRFAKDTLKFAPQALFNFGISGLLFGQPLAILLSPIGFSVGRYIVNKKKKQKTTYKQIADSARIGVWGSTLGIAAYSLPDYLFPGSSALAKLSKWALFEGVFVPPLIGWLKASYYIAEKYGTKVRDFTIDLPKRFGDIYKNSLKGKYVKSTLETIATLGPIHLASFFLFRNPLYRMTVGAVNDVLLAMIGGEEGLLKSLVKKFRKKPEQNYQPSNQPAYQT